MMSDNLTFSGTLMINGVSVENVDKISNQVAYVMQDDILMATFTPLG
jgi:ABC-type multidrug transport system ATPase subunit